MKWFALWLILAAIFAFGLGSINVPLFEHLTEKGVRSQATATQLTREYHNTVRYEYVVIGTKYEGQDQSWRPNPPVEQIKVGQSLIIFYDPLNPSCSVLGDPKPMLTNELFAVGLGALFAPTFIVVVLMRKIRDAQRKLEAA